MDGVGATLRNPKAELGPPVTDTSKQPKVEGDEGKPCSMCCTHDESRLKFQTIIMSPRDTETLVSPEPRVEGPVVARSQLSCVQQIMLAALTDILTIHDIRIFVCTDKSSNTGLQPPARLRLRGPTDPP